MFLECQLPGPHVRVRTGNYMNSVLLRSKPEEFEDLKQPSERGLA